MFLKQITNDQTGCVSYIGYCASCAVGYVIDPLENIEPYLKIAKDNDIKITHIFDTHVQADHISGDKKLAKETGAKIYMHESAKVSYPFEPVKEGDVISIGTPEQLYDSVRKLFALEDYVAVMPSHYGRSQCGVGLSSIPISTIGYEKRFNRAIDSLSDREKFVDYIKGLKTMEIPDYHRIKRLNMNS